MRRANRLLCLGLAAISLTRADAVGCSCLWTPSVSQALSEAQAVFVGRVVSKRPTTRGTFWETSPGEFAYEFRVERSWKGVTGPSVIILTGAGGGDCGWPFELGGRYLVYAHDSEGLRTNICTRTASIGEAGGDLAALGLHQIAFIPVSTSPVLGSILSAFMALIALGIGIVIGRRWERSRLETTFDFGKHDEEMKGSQSGS